MYTHRRRILFGDCDPGGVVYTPRIAHFVVEASLDFLRHRLGGPAERRLFEMGIAPPARALSFEFLLPMSWDDELEIEVRVAEIRIHAIVLSLTGRVAGDDAFTAELTLVCVSLETRRPTPIPTELREALTR